MTTMQPSRSRVAGLASVSAVSLLLLSACAGDNGDSADSNGNGDDNGEVEETVEAVSPEERLSDYWTDAQAALSEEELNELNEAAFSSPEEEDGSMEMLSANEELNSIIDEYFNDPDISEEKLQEYQIASTEELTYALAILPAQMDQMMDFAVDFQDDMGEEEEADDSDFDTDEGVYIMEADDAEGSDAGTASVSFIPNSMISAYQYLGAEAEEGMTAEEIIESIEADGEGFFTFWYVFEENEWLLDVEATVDELENIGSDEAEDSPDFEDSEDDGSEKDSDD